MINAQKSPAFLFSDNERSEGEIKAAIPYIITSKSTKYLRINLPKEMKDLYSENFKKMIKEIKDDTNRSTETLFLDWKNQYCQKWFYHAK